jgi:hypothetical protein
MLHVYKKWVEPVLIAVAVLSGIGWLYLAYSLQHKETLSSAQSQIHEMVAKILSQCQRDKISGSYNEIRVLKGDPNENLSKAVLPMVLGELYSPENKSLKVIVPPDQYAQKVKDIRAKLLAEHVPDDQVGDFIDRMLSQSGSLAADLDAELSWRSVDAAHHTVGLDLKFTSKKVAEASAEFTDPAYEVGTRDLWSRQAGWQVVAMWSGSVAAVLWLLGAIWFFFRKRGMAGGLSETIAKLESLIGNGSYTAAAHLGEEALAAFPDDSDLRGFLERLGHVTHNDPRKAEGAYLRYLNLQTKLKTAGSLTPEELSEVSRLDKYLDLPEINAFQVKCKAIQEYRAQLKQADELRLQIEDHKRRGELREAKEKSGELKKVSSQLKSAPRALEASGLNVALLEGPAGEPGNAEESDVDGLEAQCEARWEQAENALGAGRVGEAYDLLEAVLKLDREHLKAKDALTRLKKAAGEANLRLEPLKVGRNVWAFRKDHITAFRPDAAKPDVALMDSKISRDKHLRLSLVNNEVVAEDAGSSNGVFVRGEKIKRILLEDGDVVDLAHSMRWIAHLYFGNESGSRAGETMAPVAESSRKGGKQDKGDLGGVVFESEDQLFAIVNDALPVKMGSMGLIFDKGGDCRLRREKDKKGDFLILETPNAKTVLCPGEMVEYKGARYAVRG